MYDRFWKKNLRWQAKVHRLPALVSGSYAIKEDEEGYN